MLRKILGLLTLVGLAIVGLALFSLWRTHQAIAATETLDPHEGAPGRFVQVGDFEIHLQEWGDPEAPAVLLLHGFGAAGGIKMSSLAGLLADAYHVVAPDMLGMGRSERVADPGSWYTVSARASRMANLLDALEMERVAGLVGVSFGGAVALQAAIEQPNRYDGLVVIDAQAYDSGGGVFQLLGALPLGVGSALAYPEQGAGSIEALRSSYEAVCASGGNCPNRAEVEREWELRTILGTSQAIRAIAASPVDARIPAELGEINAATLVIWGADDLWIPLAEGRRLAEDIPNAELAVIAGAGHLPYKDRPEEVAGLIRDFLLAARQAKSVPPPGFSQP